MEEFKDIKKDDLVTMFYHDSEKSYPSKVRKVERILKTYIVVDGIKFNFNGTEKRSGYSSYWYSLKEYDESHSKSISLANKKFRLKKYINEIFIVKIDSLNIEQLDNILNLLTEL